VLRKQLLVLSALWTCALWAVAATNVTTWRNDLGRTGQNLNETQLTLANVNSTTFGKLFSYPVDGQVYAQPLYMSGIAIAGGTHNVLFIATQHDSVYALDADHNQQLWHASMIDTAHGAPSGATSVSSADMGSYDINPEYGITSTPVIDPTTSTIYVVANSEESGAIVWRLHALDLGTGREKTNSPVVIRGSVAGTGNGSVNGRVAFQAKYELSRTALLLLNGQVILGFGSHSDNGPYHGWLIAYDAATLLQTGIYNTSPNGGQNGIWMSGAAPAADTVITGGRIFFSNGNGTFDAQEPYSNSQGFGNAVERVDLTSNGFQVMDEWTPFDTHTLNSTDIDQGSGGVLLLPDQPGSHVHELIQVGKNGRIELLDRDNMGGYNSNSNNVVQEISLGYGLWATPAYWNGNVYFWASGLQMRQYRLSNGLLSTTPVANSAMYSGYPGPSPIVSANGTNNAIVWAIRADAFGTPGPAVLLAYDATNIGKLLYASSQNSARDAAGPAVKFGVPMVANGKVYLGTQDEVDVYGLLSSAPPTVPPPTFTPAPGSYSSTQDVAISDSLGSATIYYTTDGTVPTTSSNRYTGTIPISSSTTLEAIGVASGYTTSSVSIAKYSVGPPPTINFSNGFASVAGLTLNGSAVNADDTRLQLTTGGQSQAGSAFWNTPVGVQTFSTDFLFQLSGSGLLADGITFTIQNDAPTALGPAGGGLGYGAGIPGRPLGIPSSVAVKFDMWQNVDEGNDSTGLYINGASPTTPFVPLTGTGIVLASGDTFSAHMSYDGKTLSLTITDLVTGASVVRSFPVDLPSTIGSTAAYVGFTGGTGGLTASQKILTWTFTANADVTPVVYQLSTLKPAATSGAVYGPYSWSGFPDSTGMFYNATKAGDYISFTINVPKAGTYDVHASSKNFSSRGIWQLRVDGVNLGAQQDEYSSNPGGILGDLDAGPVVLKTAGNHTFTFTVAGKNASSTGYALSLDDLTLKPE
jgi:hypothetical protein